METLEDRHVIEYKKSLESLIEYIKKYEPVPPTGGTIVGIEDEDDNVWGKDENTGNIVAPNFITSYLFNTLEPETEIPIVNNTLMFKVSTNIYDYSNGVDFKEFTIAEIYGKLGDIYEGILFKIVGIYDGALAISIVDYYGEIVREIYSVASYNSSIIDYPAVSYLPETTANTIFNFYCDADNGVIHFYFKKEAQYTIFFDDDPEIYINPTELSLTHYIVKQQDNGNTVFWEVIENNVSGIQNNNYLTLNFLNNLTNSLPTLPSDVTDNDHLGMGYYVLEFSPDGYRWTKLYTALNSGV
jgi:hypothetical protein